MPIRISFRLAIVPVLCAIFLLSGCSGVKYDIHDMMIGHELKRAGLSPGKLDLDGNSIAYLESVRAPGKPTLVLIHGFAASKENWVRFAGHLTDRFHVVAIDLPGHGESVKRFDIPYAIPDQVNYLHDILSKLNIDRSHLAGNSMGGAIVALYASRHPGEVLSITLFDPAGIYDYESELFKQLKSGGKNLLIVENKEDFENLIDFAMEKKPFIPWPVKGIFAERAVANRPINEKIFADIRKKETNYDFKAAIARITAPALILWGDHDRIVHVDNAAVFEQLIPGSRKHIFEGVGHAPMLEIPGESAEIVESFIFPNNSSHTVSLDKSEMAGQ